MCITATTAISTQALRLFWRTPATGIQGILGYRAETFHYREQRREIKSVLDESCRGVTRQLSDDAANRAAIYLKSRSRDIGGCILEQEHCGPRQFPGFAIASQWDTAFHSLPMLFERDALALTVDFIQMTNAIGCKSSGRELIDPDPRQGQIVGQGFGEGRDRRAQHIGQREVEDGFFDSGRSQNDDAAFVPSRHGGNHNPDEPDHAHQQELKSLLPGSVVERHGRADCGSAAVCKK